MRNLFKLSSATGYKQNKLNYNLCRAQSNKAPPEYVRVVFARDYKVLQP